MLVIPNGDLLPVLFVCSYLRILYWSKLVAFFEGEARLDKYDVARDPAVHGKILCESIISKCQYHLVSVNTECQYLELFSLGVFCFSR